MHIVYTHADHSRIIDIVSCTRREHCCFSLVISILISFQLVFMMLTIFSSILVIVKERFLKIVLF